MKKWLLVIFLIISRITSAQDLLDEVIRNQIEAAGVPPVIIIGTEQIHANTVLPVFYERRGYKAAWCMENDFLPHTYELIRCLRDANEHGLNPDDYHLQRMKMLVANLESFLSSNHKLNLVMLAQLDLLCTDAFLVFGSHLVSGKVNPETIDSEWMASKREVNMLDLIESAIQTGQITRTFDVLLPRHTGYELLSNHLKKYYEIESKGGWPKISQWATDKFDPNDPSLSKLQYRLRISGDLANQKSKDQQNIFSVLETSIRLFQYRHGLEITGRLDSLTLYELNIPVEERIRQLKINLERWRWLPQDLGNPYVIINIPNFELDLIKENKSILQMRVVVGKPYRRTPVFSDKITYLVFNPYWYVPKNIAVNDILPQIRQDIDYFSSKKMRVFYHDYEPASEIDPSTINWTGISKENFNYLLRQDPGPLNALGNVKFMFPNKFNVYLHDTPSRDLFEKTERTFSSGCIRASKPIELAEYLVSNNSSYPLNYINTLISSGIEQTLTLNKPMPIHIQYWTAWVDVNGILHFRKDIYNRDETLYDALIESPPTTRIIN